MDIVRKCEEYFESLVYSDYTLGLKSPVKSIRNLPAI